MRYLILLAGVAWLSAAAPVTVKVADGNTSFLASTNIPAVTVHGKSKELTGFATLQHQHAGLVLEELQARLSVQSLSTGMGLRDRHMRELVFTADGKAPDLVFRAERTECTPHAGAFSCSVRGDLSIRGTAKPFDAVLKVREEGSGRFHAVGEGSVRLKDYGIDPPSQFGVRVKDEIQLKFEFTATAGTVVAERLP
jgi:polyisoprenoid-binding protein YceI